MVCLENLSERVCVRVCVRVGVGVIIEVSLQVAAQSLLDWLYGMDVKLFTPFCSIAAKASGLISPAACHRFTRNLILHIRVTPTPSVTCMSSRKVESRLFSQSDASDSKLIALILNYKLPTQVQKLLHKGKACSSGQQAVTRVFSRQ